MTESPQRNILLMNRSLFTSLAFFFPFPVFGTCRNKKICHCQAKTKANKRSRLTPTESTELKMTDSGDLLTTSIWELPQTTPWYFPGPYCNGDQKPSHGLATSCCSNNWWAPGLIDIVSTERGPVENSSSVFSVSSSIGLAPLMVTVQASPPSLQSSCNSDDLKENENEGGRRRQRNRCSKKLEIAKAAKTRSSPRKKTIGTQKTREHRFGFWMGLWNSGMWNQLNEVLFSFFRFSEPDGSEFLSYWGIGWLCFYKLGMLLWHTIGVINWGYV
jgi:hypothetical protein